MTLATPNPFEVVRKASGWFLTLGIVLVLLGLIALTYTCVATIASMVFFGWLLIFSGAVHIFQAVQSTGWKGFGLHLLVGLVDAFLGVWFLTHPLVAAAGFTLFLAMFFIASGLLQIIAGIARHVPNVTWVIISGLISLVLGICIFARWPAASFWFMGMFIGISMIFRGWMWIMIATAARRLTAPAA